MIEQRFSLPNPDITTEVPQVEIVEESAERPMTAAEAYLGLTMMAGAEYDKEEREIQKRMEEQKRAKEREQEAKAKQDRLEHERRQQELQKANEKLAKARDDNEKKRK